MNIFLFLSFLKEETYTKLKTHHKTIYNIYKLKHVSTTKSLALLHRKALTCQHPNFKSVAKKYTTY